MSDQHGAGVGLAETVEEAQAAYDRALAELEEVKGRLAAEPTRALSAASQQAQEAANAAYQHLLTFYPATEASPAAEAEEPVPEAAVAVDESAFSASSPDVAADIPAQAPVLVKRPGVQRFVPPASEKPAAPLVKERLLARTTHRTEISRERKIAGGLPEWEPLPPGEILVRAGRS